MRVSGKPTRWCRANWLGGSIIGVLLVVACSPSASAPATGQGAPSTGGQATQPSAAVKPAASDSKIIVRLGHAQTLAHHQHLAAQKFADLVAQKTNGKAEVKIFPNGQLGGPREHIEAIRQGGLEMTQFGADVVEPILPVMGTLALPYLWDREKADRMLSGDLGKQMSEKLKAATGVSVIAWTDLGSVSMITKSKTIKAPADLKGLKMRVPEVPSVVKLFQMWGANPTVVAFNEVYNALQTGVVDGAVTPPDGMVTQKWHEVSKQLSLTRHIFIPTNVLISDKFLQAQPADVKKGIEDAAHEAFEVFDRDLFTKVEGGAIQTMKDSGVTVTEPDLEPFKKGVETIWKEFTDKVPDAGPIVKIIQETK
ncbi:MAG: TRAP transporter substrate-binding protein [Chloroflexi bacterium]|nr:TRAP transporter substrate-binding protein [Chloroflexota bacterium]